MAGIGDASLIGSKRDFTVDSGAADLELRGSGACVEELDQAVTGDDQDNMSVSAETNGALVPAIGTKETRLKRLFQRVERQIFAGNGKQALVGAELEIVQRTLRRLTCEVAVPGGPFEIVIGPCAVPAAIHRPVPLTATFEILRSIGRLRGAGQNIQTEAEITAKESAITTGFFNGQVPRPRGAGRGIARPYKGAG